MFDGGSSGSGLGRFAWFQLGRMSAESSQRDLQTLDLVRDGLAGRRPVMVDQSYIDQLIDQIRINDGEVQKANNTIRAYMADVASWKEHANQWEQYAKALEVERDDSNLLLGMSNSLAERYKTNINNNLEAFVNLRYFATNLQRFAEAGLANEPEYKQLAVRQQAAWANFANHRTITEIGDAVKDLVDTLERKVPR